MNPHPRALVTLCLAALLSASACSGAATTTHDPGARDPRPSTAESSPNPRPELRGLDDRWPAVINGQFAVSRTKAYDRIQVPSLTDMPYKGRGMSIDSSYAGVSDVEQLARRSRVIARGTIVALSRPHFNSDDGSFWDPELVSEPGIVPSESFVMRDVTMHVDTVHGTKVSGVEAGKELTFVARGGQVQVVLDAATAKKLTSPKGASTRSDPWQTCHSRSAISSWCSSTAPPSTASTTVGTATVSDSIRHTNDTSHFESPTAVSPTSPSPGPCRSTRTPSPLWPKC